MKADLTIPGIHGLTGRAALGVGVRVLAQGDAIAAPPEGREVDAADVAQFVSLLARARALHDRLTVSVTAVIAAEVAYSAKIEAALAEEEAADGECSAIRGSLLAEIRSGTSGSAVLNALFFPDGLVAVTRPTGGAQVAVYEELVPVMGSEAAKSNPAHPIVAAKITSLTSKAATLKATIQVKDKLESDLKAARAARDKDQRAWTALFRRLLAAGAEIQGAESDAFRGWVRPILDWRANQDGLQTRRANEQEAPSTVTPTPTPAEGEG